MKIKLKTPVREAVQYKKNMAVGWATRSGMQASIDRFTAHSVLDSWTFFPFESHEDAEAEAKAVYRKKDAQPYWEFEGHVLVNPIHNRYYWIENGKVNSANLNYINELYDILD